MQLQQNLAALNQVDIIQYIAPSAKKPVMSSPLLFLQIQMLHHRWTKPLRRTSWGRSSPRRRTGWSSFWWIFRFCWSTEHRRGTQNTDRVKIKFPLINRTQSRHKDTQNTEQTHRTQTGRSSIWWIFSFCWSTEHRTQTGWKSNFRWSTELCAVSLNNSVCRY